MTEEGLVRRFWVDGLEERIWKSFPEDSFETVKTRIVGGDERQVEGGWWRPQNSCF